jgi:hypothetical protein
LILTILLGPFALSSSGAGFMIHILIAVTRSCQVLIILILFP